MSVHLCVCVCLQTILPSQSFYEHYWNFLDRLPTVFQLHCLATESMQNGWEAVKNSTKLRSWCNILLLD